MTRNIASNIERIIWQWTVLIICNESSAKEYCSQFICNELSNECHYKQFVMNHIPSRITTSNYF